MPCFVEMNSRWVTSLPGWVFTQVWQVNMNLFSRPFSPVDEIGTSLVSVSLVRVAEERVLSIDLRVGIDPHHLVGTVGVEAGDVLIEGEKLSPFINGGEGGQIDDAER